MADRTTFTTHRDDGRFLSTAGFLHAYMKHMRPKLAFDPEMQPDAFSG